MAIIVGLPNPRRLLYACVEDDWFNGKANMNMIWYVSCLSNNVYVRQKESTFSVFINRCCINSIPSIQGFSASAKIAKKVPAPATENKNMWRYGFGADLGAESGAVQRKWHFEVPSFNCTEQNQKHFFKSTLDFQ